MYFSRTLMHKYDLYCNLSKSLNLREANKKSIGSHNIYMKKNDLYRFLMLSYGDTEFVSAVEGKYSYDGSEMVSLVSRATSLFISEFVSAAVEEYS